MPVEWDAGRLAPGEIISDRYRIVRKIAQGGMGVVYEAEHLKLSGLRVAIKVLLGKHDHKSEYIGRFRREAEIASRVSHPHIISVSDWDRLPDGSSYFVMEFLEGESLGDAMNRGPLIRTKSLSILKQIGSALAFAHQQGIVHRDLKPSNVFLVSADREVDEEIHVKVLDFGISKDLGAETLKITQSTILGSPRHMSPEQARGLNDLIDARSDQFSLATIAYELFTGQPAFASDTIESTLFKIVHEDPEPIDGVVPDLPEHVVRALARAMRKQPDARFPSVSAFIRALLGRDTAANGNDSGHRRAEALTVDARPESPTVDERPPSSKTGVVVRRDDEAPAQVGAETLMRAQKRAWGGRRLVMVVIFVLAALATGVGLYVFLPGDGAPARDGVDPAISEEPVRNEAPAPEDAGVAGAGADAATEDGDPAADIADEGTPSRPDAGLRTVRPPVRIKVRKEVAEKLDRADRLFARKRYPEAIRLARQSIIIQDTPRARILITLGYCALNDLGNSKASLFKVPAADKKRIVNRCRELGLNL